MPEEVQEHVDHPLDLGVVDVREQLRGTLPGDAADLRDGQGGVEVEVSAQGVGDGEPDVGFAVWNARAFEHGGIHRVVHVVDQLVGQT